MPPKVQEMDTYKFSKILLDGVYTSDYGIYCSIYIYGIYCHSRVQLVFILIKLQSVAELSNIFDSLGENIAIITKVCS